MQPSPGRGKSRNTANGKQSVDGVDFAILQASPAADPRIEWLYARIRELNEIDRSLTLLLLDGFSYKEMASCLASQRTTSG